MPLLDQKNTKQSPPKNQRLTPEMVIQSIAPSLSSKRRTRIERVIHRRLLSVTVVLENLYDPHNGAAVLRTCEAMGLFHVHVVTNETGFQFAYKITHRADKWLNVYQHDNIESCFAYLKNAGFACWGAFPPPLENAEDPITVPVYGPVALAFGNEHEGLTDQAKALCDGVFHIPMFGFSESLNLSVSAALALQDVTLRRRETIGCLGDFPPNALERLRAAYYAKASSHAVDLLLNELRSSQ